MAAAPGTRRCLRCQRDGHLRRPAARRGNRKVYALLRAVPVRLGSRTPGGPLWHQGIAGRDLDRLRLGRHRDPTRRRGDPPRRGRRRAGVRHRRVGEPGKPDPLLAAVRAVHPQRSAAGGCAPVQQGPRRLRDGRGCRCAGAGKPRARQGTRRDASSAWWKAAARWRTGSIAPGPRRTASRSSPACGTRWTMRDWRRTRSATSTRTAPARRRTTRWSGSRVSAVFGERAASIPISSNKSMIGHTLTAAGTVEAIFTLLAMRHGRLAADHQLRDAGPGAAGGLRAERRARCAGGARDFQFVRLRRAERLPGDGAAVRCAARW